uniref:Cilia- and flagella-associated protein 45 n=1 Tax=Glossina brevipalpis TaxID=37001 RepID=A0A1A9WE82_9MUSC
MPCFSACPKRTQKHAQQEESFGRAKTAARSDSDVTFPKYACKKPNQYMKCHNVFYTQTLMPREVRTSLPPKVQLPPKELERLKAASKVVTLEDRLDDLMRKEMEMRRLEEEAERTREHFKKIDDARKKKAEEIALVQKGEEVQDKLQVLEKAFLAKHEQEEEVKKVNRIILDAKCHAVRDAQIQEKSKLFKELRREEIRLEQQVIERAMKSLNAEDDQFDKKQEEKQKYAEEIKKQLLERENQRFLEAERIEKEAKMLREINEAFKRDEQRQQQLAKERRLKFRDELAQVVEMSNVFKRMLCEQERTTEMKIAAYMREKDERFRALAHEKKLQKQEHDRKHQRLFNLAQKALESRSQRDEITYLRQREHLEREYRQKEKEAAMKKRQIEKELSDAREHQLQETKHRQALQIARAEQDFNVLVERLKKEEEEDRKLDLERQRKRNCYRMDIIRQMGDKEMERRRLLDLERSEASAWRERERQRDANIKAVINAKLAAMRDACLPEKIINHKASELERGKVTGAKENSSFYFKKKKEKYDEEDEELALLLSLVAKRRLAIRDDIRPMPMHFSKCGAKRAADTGLSQLGQAQSIGFLAVEIPNIS